MTFLAGPPDRGPGSVLKRKRPSAPLVPPPMTDISYTSLALGLQPSPQEAMHRNGKDDEPSQLFQVQIWPELVFDAHVPASMCAAAQSLHINTNASSCDLWIKLACLTQPACCFCKHGR